MIEGSNSRLDELRVALQHFTAETSSALRKETLLTAPSPKVIDFLGVPKSSSKENQEKEEEGECLGSHPKVARLLSTRYGKTCFDVIIAKTPEMACLH